METPIGRHVQAALDNQLVSVSRPGPDPDIVRRLFEQIGSLYAAVSGDGTEVSTFPATDELADFLDTVRRAMRNPGGQTAAALRLALHRYEHARNPRGDA